MRPISLGIGSGIGEVILPFRTEILRLGRSHGALGFRVLEAARRRETGTRSDVELVVKMRASASWLDFAALHVDLESLLGKRVELVEEGQLHWSLRPKIESEAVRL